MIKLENRNAKRTLGFLKFAALFILAACGTVAHADASRCNDRWVQVEESKDLSQLLRSNADHYWTWVGKEGPAHFESLFSFQGLVAADPHLNNFGPMAVKGKIRWTLTDIDDVGIGSFAADVARFVLMAEVASNKAAKKKDLIDAYIKGLKKQSLAAPSEIQTTLKMGANEIRNAEAEIAQDIQSEPGKIKTNKERISLGSEANYERVRSELAIHLSRADGRAQIQDIVRIERQRGGCTDCERYFVLTQNDGIQDLWDIKEIYSPAPSCAQGHLQDAVATKEQAIRNIWLGGTLDSSFQVFRWKKKAFLLRKKQWKGVDLKVSKPGQLARLLDILSYDFFVLGTIHAQSPAANEFLKVVESKPTALQEGIEKALKAYAKTYPRGF